VAAGVIGLIASVTVHIIDTSVVDVPTALLAVGAFLALNRWHAKLAPPPSAKPYVLEYYVEARDAGGGPIARIAAPDQPLEIALAAGGETAGPGRRAWYQHWYVYAGGAALAAGIGGVVVATTRGPDSGSLPPHTITVTP
jgi:hypothetical protein